AALLERVSFRLESGDLLGALDDLHAALENEPAQDVRRKARQKLYEVLTELLQRDFNAGEKYLDEYEKLCKVEVDPAAPENEKKQAGAEEERRRVGYLVLAGRGREQQGKLVEALRAYVELGMLRGNELMPAPEEPAVMVRRDTWVKGRLAELMRKANDEQRK